MIGEYIGRMLLGTLSTEYRNRWSWYKPDGYGNNANPTYSIEFDLQNSDWIDEM